MRADLWGGRGTTLWIICGHSRDTRQTPLCHLVFISVLIAHGDVETHPASHRRPVRKAVRILSGSLPMYGILVPMRRLYPHPTGTISVLEAYAASRPRPIERPWLGLCMVASLDGTTVVDNASRALSNPCDVEVLLTLRNLADVLIVGAGTVRAERYGPPRKAGQRVGVVTRTGDLPMDTALFTSGRGFLIMPERAPVVGVPSIRAGTDTVDLGAAFAQIDADFIQAEGGPALNAALAEADLIDELNLTISPQISGGDGPRLTSGAEPMLRRMDLAHVCEDDGFLFTRYLRRRP